MHTCKKERFQKSSVICTYALPYLVHVQIDIKAELLLILTCCGPRASMTNMDWNNANKNGAVTDSNFIFFRIIVISSLDCLVHHSDTHS